jgi:uncharacterized protein (DUF952 family)
MRVLHLAPTSLWRQAIASGVYGGSTRGRSLSDEGYVHASTAMQLPAVADGVYADDQLNEQILLVIDVEACEVAGSPMRWEAPDDADEAFPHFYGPIPAGAVVAALTVHRDEGRAGFA